MIWSIAMRPGKLKTLSKTKLIEKGLRRIERAKASTRAKVEHQFRVSNERRLRASFLLPASEPVAGHTVPAAASHPNHHESSYRSGKSPRANTSKQDISISVPIGSSARQTRWPLGRAIEMSR